MCELVCLSVSQDRQMCCVSAYERVHVYEGLCVPVCTCMHMLEYRYI